jgi:hypothetical protein
MNVTTNVLGGNLWMSHRLGVMGPYGKLWRGEKRRVKERRNKMNICRSLTLIFSSINREDFERV